MNLAISEDIRMTLFNVLNCYHFHAPIVPTSIIVSGRRIEIHAKLMVLVGTPLNALDQTFPVSHHAKELQQLLTREVHQHDSRFTVHVSAKNLDNMVITLTMPDEGMTPDQVKTIINQAFSRRFNAMSVHVEGA